MSKPSTALPSEWVQRLFSRFETVYGNRASLMWASADPDDLRLVWGEALAGFGAEAIRDALVVMPLNYKEFPPSMPQFVDLCADARRRRLASFPRLDDDGARPAIPEHIREQFEAIKAALARRH